MLVTRIGDTICSDPGIHTGGSPDTYANNIKVCRIGDSVSSQKCGGGICITGSPDVLVNNIKVHRTSDTVLYARCGGTSCQGSPDTLID